MSLVRHALSSNFQISMSNPTVQSERLPRTSTFEDSLRSLQQAFSYSVPSTNFFSTQSILSSAAQPRIAHARISQVVHSYSANRDQNGIFRNEENIRRSPLGVSAARRWACLPLAAARVRRSPLRRGAPPCQAARRLSGPSDPFTLAQRPITVKKF